jgi:purine-binding chemotaxis protein CheW
MSTQQDNASPTSNEVQSEFDRQYVSFWIGDQLLGVPVRVVQEVLNPQEIARIPRARPEISGLLNLRGQIVTAVNLRRRLQLPDLEEGRESINVVVRHNGEPFSILVDEVGDVTATLDAVWRGVTTGVYRMEGRLFVIVDVAAILDFGLRISA